MQPVIGITMCFDRDDMIKTGVEYNYIRREYGIALQRVGAQPLFIDPTIDPMIAAKLCDGIVISGGEDIDPTLYGQTVAGALQQEPRERTDWECRLIDACDEWNRPILGICYGEQLLNVHYGGTLFQDIATDCHSQLSHGTSDKASMHEVVFEDDFLGFKKGEKKIVAARHHQAIHQLADGFKVIARSNDGGIEAIAGRGHYGVQWHSESDDTADKIYGEFVKVCANQARPAQAVQSTAFRSRRLSGLLARFK